jgi:hypothetical protein
MLPINSKFSSAITKLSGNPFTGAIRVTFTSSPKEYLMQAHRREILQAAILPPVSAGQWVNRHCWAV